MSIENADQLETYSDTAIDFYELEEEDLLESAAQSRLINYLIEVLKWLYRLERCYITTNLAIYQAGYKPIAPDVALFKGVAFTEAELDGLKSWQMSQPGRPAPAVVFEISSEDTWPKDLNEKILRYQQLGAKEYFAYDPGSP